MGASYYRLGKFQDAEETVNGAAWLVKGTGVNTQRLEDWQLKNRMYRVMAQCELGETESAQRLFSQSMDWVQKIQKTDRRIHTRTLRLIDETGARLGPYSTSPAR